MHIGLIGGIGPAATIAYYDRLSRIVHDAGGNLDATIVNGNLEVAVANLLADRRADQARNYARLIDRLKAAGAACAAITSFGGHFCYPETVPIASLPMVSAIKPLDEHFVANGIHRIGLLGTEVVMRTRCYGQLVRTDAVVPDDDLAALGKEYLDIAVADACTPEQRTRFIEAGRRLVEDQGAEAVVLAGTDLGIVFDGSVNPGYPVIDALDVHVAVLADLALDRRTLDGLA